MPPKAPLSPWNWLLRFQIPPMSPLTVGTKHFEDQNPPVSPLFGKLPVSPLKGSWNGTSWLHDPPIPPASPLHLYPRSFGWPMLSSKKKNNGICWKEDVNILHSKSDCFLPSMRYRHWGVVRIRFFRNWQLDDYHEMYWNVANARNRAWCPCFSEIPCNNFNTPAQTILWNTKHDEIYEMELERLKGVD